MIEYNEDWLCLLLLKIRGPVLWRAASYALFSASFTVVVLLSEEYFPEFRDDSGLADISESQIWTAMSAVLMMALTVRTRQALSRFWDGTTLLHMMRGEWYDSISCLIAFSRAAKATKPAEVLEFRQTLIRLMSLCHGSALDELKDEDENAILDTLDVMGLDNKTLLFLRKSKELGFNRVEVLVHYMQTLITAAHDSGVLKVPPPILSRVYQTLSRGLVNVLNAKKIVDTRFPFPYAQLIAIFLYVSTIMTPLMISVIVKSKAWAAFLTFVVVFAYFAVDFIAIELENPFGSDDNDLPLQHFQECMNDALLMLVHDDADHLPSISTRAITTFEGLYSTRFGGHPERTVMDPKKLKEGRGSMIPSVVEGRAGRSSTATRGSTSSAASAASSLAGAGGRRASGFEEMLKKIEEDPLEEAKSTTADLSAAVALPMVTIDPPPLMPGQAKDLTRRASEFQQIAHTIERLDAALQRWTAQMESQEHVLEQTAGAMQHFSETLRRSGGEAWPGSPASNRGQPPSSQRSRRQQDGVPWSCADPALCTGKQLHVSSPKARLPAGDGDAGQALAR